MGILIDTSVIIDYLRRKDKLNSWFYQLSLKGDDLAISIITHAELYSGKSIYESSKNKKILDNIVSKLEVITLDLATSALGGQLRSKTNRDLFDCLIAATAIKNECRLATLNTKHFVDIKGLKIIKTSA